jgi:hypothetical protein
MFHELAHASNAIPKFGQYKAKSKQHKNNT